MTGHRSDIAGAAPIAAMLVAIRRVIRAVDLHSKHLAQSHQLTGPQALVLRELAGGELAPSDLARRISLSQATVTDIVKRLERRGLLSRAPDAGDRRRVLIRLSASGRRLHDQSPPLLQDTFARRFSALAQWEQYMLVAAVQRVASLMDAEAIDAAPLLSSETLEGAGTRNEANASPDPTTGDSPPRR